MCSVNVKLRRPLNARLSPVKRNRVRYPHRLDLWNRWLSIGRAKLRSLFKVDQLYQCFDDCHYSRHERPSDLEPICRGESRWASWKRKSEWSSSISVITYCSKNDVNERNEEDDDDVTCQGKETTAPIRQDELNQREEYGITRELVPSCEGSDLKNSSRYCCFHNCSQLIAQTLYWLWNQTEKEDPV